MKPIGLAGLPLTPHGLYPPPVPEPAPVGMSATVFVNGRSVHRVGDKFQVHRALFFLVGTEHSDTLITGQPTVFADGKMIAFQGSSTDHGSQVVTGSHTVFM